MENGKHLVYEFRGFQLDRVRQRLFCHGQPVALAPKLFETLVFLVENRDRTLLKDELMQALWTGTFVEEANLSQNIFLLRKALGDDRNGHSFIHTVPRRGYRFVAPVTEIETESMGPLPGARNWEYWNQHSPFRSLTVFEEEDTWLFFGREAETADLLNRVVHSPAVAVVGNSGSGKSSLLRAGLIPALREGRPVPGHGSNGDPGQESWRIAVFRPSASPFDYLAEVLPGQLAPELSVKEQAEFIAECRGKLPPGGDSLRNAISALVFAGNINLVQGGHTRVLLVVDQFEELFTLTHDAAIRDRYIDALLEAAHLSGAVPVHLVLSLRADFFGHCLDHPGLRRCLETSFNLGSMTPEQMRETIERRLRLAGGRAEPGLIDSLLQDVGAEPGNLALLEHALGQLWEQGGGPGCTLTNDAYNAIGRLRGALGRHADEVLRDLTVEQKSLSKKIFLELVHLGEGAQDTRRRVTKAELLSLGDPEEVEHLLARLVSSRLIASGREGEETFVEVSHEALIREWPALRRWLAENREDLSLERRLGQTAQEWQRLNRDSGALLQGARLAQAEDWLRSHPHAGELARDYVHASLAARSEAVHKEREAQRREFSRQKQTARRFRRFSYALAALFLIAASSAWFAYRQGILERSRAMAAQAEEMVLRDHGGALDLAMRSWQTAKTEEAHRALARALPEPVLTLTHEDAVYRTVFSPDGQRILTVAHDRAAKIWSARDGRFLAALGHADLIEHAEFSPDGQRVVTASDDHTARVWDANSGDLIAVLKGHTDKVWRAVFSPDGKRVVTVALDHTAKLWDSADGRLLASLEGHSDWVLNTKFSPDGRHIVTVGQDKTARIWDGANGKLLNVLEGHSDAVLFAEFSPDGTQVVTAGHDSTARVWNLSDGRLIHVLQHHGPVVRAIFSREGDLIATASTDKTARLWNRRTGRLIATFQHEGPVVHVEFSPDGRRIVTASFDHTAKVWDREGRLLALLQGHSRELYHAAFSPSGDQIVTGSGDRTAKLWNLYSGRATAVLRHDSLIEAVTVSRDGKWIATAADDHTARVWNPSDGSLRFVLPNSDRVWRVAFSPDSQRIATACADGSARLWDNRSGKLIAALRGHTEWITDISFSPDGQRLATASSDHTARLWNASDGSLLAVLQADGESVIQARFFPDGRRMITVKRTARIWDVSNGHLLATLRVPGDEFLTVVVSHNAGMIVTGSSKGVPRLWDSNGHLLGVLQPYSGYTGVVSFSPDDRRILGFGPGQTVLVWDSTNGHLLNSWPSNSDAGRWSLSFSPDGRRIASSGMDQTARLWDTENGRLLTTLQGHAGWVNEVKILPDEQHIVTASSDQTARIWEILTLDDMERVLSK